MSDSAKPKKGSAAPAASAPTPAPPPALRGDPRGPISKGVTQLEHVLLCWRNGHFGLGETVSMVRTLIEIGSADRTLLEDLVPGEPPLVLRQRPRPGTAVADEAAELEVARAVGLLRHDLERTIRDLTTKFEGVRNDLEVLRNVVLAQRPNAQKPEAPA